MGYQPGVCPSIDALIVKHEKGYFGDVDCPKDCLLKVAPWKPGMTQQDKDRAECARYREDIKSLQNILPKLSGACKIVAQNLLNDRTEFYKQHNCGSLLQK